MLKAMWNELELAAVYQLQTKLLVLELCIKFLNTCNHFGSHYTLSVQSIASHLTTSGPVATSPELSLS